MNCHANGNCTNGLPTEWTFAKTNKNARSQSCTSKCCPKEIYVGIMKHQPILWHKRQQPQHRHTQHPHRRDVPHPTIDQHQPKNQTTLCAITATARTRAVGLCLKSVDATTLTTVSHNLWQKHRQSCITVTHCKEASSGPKHPQRQYRFLRTESTNSFLISFSTGKINQQSPDWAATTCRSETLHQWQPHYFDNSGILDCNDWAR